uniref:Alpha,alpha-trehalose-phosphate synthase (UDP-forming) n=1 Tax=Erythrolobus australicus TaxID=1077150 RepID=A0A7S1TLK9_9RHOD
MDAVSQTLLAEFNCVPVFIPRDTLTEFYQGFCKGTLWPLFHMLTPLTDENDHTVQFDRSLWHTYCLVNRKFSDVVVALYQEDNMIWIHDYHLMVLPSQLRRRLTGSKIGFFLHIPWPSSEAYRTLPVRDELLRGLLSSTLLGFHLFDYARHFLSACVRLLNIEHEARRGILGVEYSGRHVMIRVSHIGIDPTRFTTHLGSEAVQEKKEELGLVPIRNHRQHVLAAIDDLDVFKGISLKLLAFENLLQAYTTYRGRVVLVQVAIPKKARVKSIVQSEIRELVEQINTKYGKPGYTPVIYIERDISFDERIAIYSEADALLLTPIRDGLNLIPYEYIVSSGNGKGQLILSEFTGCSRALSSAVRLNPWNYDEVMSAIDRVLQRDPEEIMLKHAADRKYVESHPTAKWAESFLTDLTQASEPVQKLLKLGLGLGVGLRVLEFEGFEALNAEKVVRAYDASEANNTERVFLLDYDGTLTMSTCSSRMSHAWARPSDAAMQYLAALARDSRNHVYIMSGRTKEVLMKTFAGIPAIGLAAEHGFYYRSPNSTEWTTLQEVSDLSWREVALEIMQGYAERTDGSYIEDKSAGLVWHYLDADPEFGNWQAKEMRDHLETVLNAFEVQVVTGHGWLQVRLQNMNKGAMTEKILKELLPDGSSPGFVLCLGDDRTDEDMFTILSRELDRSRCELFTCTVGVKPSNANYYLRTSDEVVDLLGLISMTSQRPTGLPATTVAAAMDTHRARSTTVSDFRDLARPSA